MSPSFPLVRLALSLALVAVSWPGVGLSQPDGAALQRTVGTVEDGLAAVEDKTYQRAMGILFPHAVAGDPRAQDAVGWMMSEGLGVPVDDCIATIWFDRAARQGHARAQVSLAFAYASGDGVAQDHELAYLWLAHAARLGHAGAAEELAFFASYLSPEVRAALDKKLDGWRPSDQPPAVVNLLPGSPPAKKLPLSWDNPALGTGYCGVK